MAEPLDPNTPGAPGGGNGGNNTIDRDMTPLASKQKINSTAVFVVASLGLVLFMWWVGAFSEEEPAPAPAPAPVQTQDAPPVPLPAVPPPAPPAYTPPTPAPSNLAAERERLLLLKVRGLQKQMFERRRSPMLVVSDPVATPAAPALPADGSIPSPAAIPSPFGGDPYDDNPNTPRMGDVGPVVQQEAVAARLLRTTGYTITEGTVIPAILETAIHSDLPGLTRALNSADVYSHDGSQLLIPKGSRLVGRYQSSTRRGQVRIFIIWTQDTPR